ncbi:MAG: DUF1735 domain-containing protein [Bacteroidales bacterium]|nr:DUF1735 domain-containing protein [Bacteroidales bacterium]
MKESKLLLLFLAFLMPLSFSSCEKGDGDLDYGEGFIYIAQATLTGGLNNYCTVPSGWGPDTFNYVLDASSLKVYVSVTRSGKISGAQGFTVKLNDDQALAQAAVASGEIGNAALLPSSSYTLPATLSVEEGKNVGTSFVSVDRAYLESHIGENLVMALSISDPSAYKLAESNTSVVIIIETENLFETN